MHNFIVSDNIVTMTKSRENAVFIELPDVISNPLSQGYYAIVTYLKCTDIVDSIFTEPWAKILLLRT